MGCAYRANDGTCLRGVKNLKCAEGRCVHWEGTKNASKEENYQQYIDDLHRQIDEQLGIITELTDKLEKYETAMVNAFVKWSEAE